MRKYKVNREQPVKMPSKEAIEKYKDFSRLRHEYDDYVKRPKKPLYKDRKMYWFILLILLITYLIIQTVKENEEEDSTKDHNPKTESVQSNIP